MDKRLSLVFPIFNISKNELDNLTWIIKNTSEHVDIIILSDSLEDNKHFEIFKTLKCTFKKTDRNIGKFQVIKNAVDNKIIKTEFLKVCDPDDFILIKNLKIFVRKLNKVKSNSIIRLLPSKNIGAGTYKVSELNLKTKGIKYRWLLSLVNENTIINSKHLIEFNLTALNQTKSSDILLSLSTLSRENYKIKSLSKSFYVYNLHNGISGKGTNLIYIEELISFLDIMINFNHINRMKEPSFWDYRWAHNNLVDMEIEIEKKLSFLEQIFNKLSICAKNNFYWRKKWNNNELEIYKEMMIKGEKI